MGIIAPVIVGLIALIGLASGGGDAKAAEKPAPRPGGCTLDASIPVELAAKVIELLGAVDRAPSELRQAAVLAQGAGYPLAAGCLRARATELEARPGPQPQPQPLPFPNPNPGPLPPGTGPGLACPLDAAMPPAVAQMVSALLTTPGTSPATLREAATLLGANGYPLAAGCLRARATELDGQQPQVIVFPVRPRPKPAPKPKQEVWTIKEGDIPYDMARAYTGDAERWRELGQANPELGPAITEESPTTGLPTTNYQNWRRGVTIRIPQAWTALKAQRNATS